MYFENTNFSHIESLISPHMMILVYACIVIHMIQVVPDSTYQRPRNFLLNYYLHFPQSKKTDLADLHLYPQIFPAQPYQCKGCKSEMTKI